MSFQQGLSGLNTAAKQLDVIGHNVANASTVGFKQSQAQFADLYAASLAGGGGLQVGTGVKLAAVAQQFSQGNVSNTNNSMDIAISGAGFFQVTDQSGAIMYSRNGQFQVDKDGYIVNNQLHRVQGYQAMAGVVTAVQGPLRIDPTPLAPKQTSNLAAGGVPIGVGANLDSRAVFPLGITQGTISGNALTGLTISDVGAPTPGSVTTAAPVTNFDYSVNSVSFSVDGRSVLLNADYTNAAGLAAAIASQINPVAPTAPLYAVTLGPANTLTIATTANNRPAPVISAFNGNVDGIPTFVPDVISGGVSTASAGSVTTGAITVFDYSTDSVGFDVDGIPVALNANYTNAAGVAAAIAAQLGSGYTVGANGAGVITITNVLPGTPAPVIDNYDGDLDAIPLMADEITGGAVTQTAGSVTTGAITVFDYSTESISFDVDGIPVALNADYTNAAGVAAAIGAQLGAGYNVSETLGVITIANAAAGTPAPIIGNYNGDLDGAPLVPDEMSGGTATETAGSVTTGALTVFDYSVNSASFEVDGNPVLLNANYTDAAGVAAAIGLQLGAGYDVSEALGVVTIAHAATGTPAPVIGNYIGAATAVPDVMTGGAVTETAGSVATPGAVTVFDYSTDSVSFDVDGTPVLLNANYANAAGVAAAIGLQLGAGYNVSEALGVITIANAATGTPAPVIAAFNGNADGGGLVLADQFGGGAVTETAGSAETGAVTVFDYSADSVSFDVDGLPVLLNANYTDAAGVAAAIGLQLGAGYNVSEALGVITIAHAATGTPAPVIDNYNGDVDLAVLDEITVGTSAETAGSVETEAVTVFDYSVNPVGFDVDGLPVLLNANYANAAGVAAAIGLQLGAGYNVSEALGVITIANVATGTPAPVIDNYDGGVGVVLADEVSGGVSTETAGSTDTGAITVFDYSASSVSFDVDGAPVVLNANYTNAAGVAAAIGAQLGAGYNVSEALGVITIAHIATGTPAPVIDNYNGGTGVVLADQITVGSSVETAGSVTTGGAVTVFNYSANTVGFDVDGLPVLLDADYTDAAGVAAAIAAQLNAATPGVYTASANPAGVITIARVSAGTPAPVIDNYDGDVDGVPTVVANMFAGATSVAGSAGANNVFAVTVDGTGPVNVTIPAGSYTTTAALANAVQAAVNAEATLIAAGKSVTVSVGASGNLVMSSTSGGVGSSIELVDVVPGTLSNLFGTAVPVVGAGVFNPDSPDSYNRSTSLSVYDSKGTQHIASLYFQKASPNTWNVYLTVDSTVVPAAGTPLTVLNFDTAGRLTGVTPTAPSSQGPTLKTVISDPTFTPLGANPLPLAFDFAQTTQYGVSFGVSGLPQDGYTSGELSSISTGSDGTIFGRYTNGQSQALGQIGLVNFTNPQGLQPVGNNEWVETPQSGLIPLNRPGSSGLGVLQSSAVEDSNVDLTAELVNMITAQRVYQANAQTIKTQDQILQTLVNMR